MKDLILTALVAMFCGSVTYAADNSLTDTEKQNG